MKRWIIRRVIDRIGFMNILAVLFLSAVPALIWMAVRTEWESVSVVGAIFVAGIAILATW